MLETNTKIHNLYKQYQEVGLAPFSDACLVSVHDFLYKRIIVDTEIAEFKQAIKREKKRRATYEKRVQRIRDEQVPILNNKLECAYDLVYFLHLKLIAMIQNGLPPADIEEYLRDSGRTIGSKVYDLPAIRTGLFSLNALVNVVDTGTYADKTTKNTDEHFFSLYATAGPYILHKAVLRTTKNPEIPFSFVEFVRMVSHLNQTIKTTREENARLQKYHYFNTMIGVQHSYEQAHVSPLIDCGLDDNSDIYLKWMYLCRELGFDLQVDAGKHFDEVTEFTIAETIYPKLLQLKDIQGNK